jgi:major membrane immunogen (membrane-anchored lipoprotein)
MRRVILLLVAVATVLCLLSGCGTADRTSARSSAPRQGTHEQTSDRAVSSPPTASRGHLLIPQGRHVVFGRVVHTDYGPVQVRVTAVDQRLADIVAVQLPHASPLDRQLSKPAADTLRRQVLAAQSVDVDSVSGATYTSAGYLQSLESALRKLKG